MLIETLIILLKIIIVLFGGAMTAGAVMTVVERKQSAWIQNRIGPNRANLRGHIMGPELLSSFRLGGLVHLAADGIKMIFKEDIIPARGNRFLHTLAPMLVMFPILVLFAVIPWMDYWCAGGDLIVIDYRDVCLSESTNAFSVADLDVGLLFIFAIASLGVYGVAIAGWASNSKYAILGGLRSSAQMLSYEVPMSLSVLGIVLIYRSLNLNEITRAQGDLLFGVIPAWGIFLQPVAFLVFFTAMLAETKRAPFDVPEGESEISTGYLTEYTGLKFGIMAMSEFIAVVFVAAVVSVLFLGGWQVPYLYGDGFHMPTPWLYGVIVLLSLGAAAFFFRAYRQSRGRLPAALSALAFLHGVLFVVAAMTQKSGFLALPYGLVVVLRIGAILFKTAVLVWFQLMLRWTLPRFRYDQIMRLGWKILIPVAVLNLIVTALVLIPFYR